MQYIYLHAVNCFCSIGGCTKSRCEVIVIVICVGCGGAGECRQRQWVSCNQISCLHFGELFFVICGCAIAMERGDSDGTGFGNTITQPRLHPKYTYFRGKRAPTRLAQ